MRMWLIGLLMRWMRVLRWVYQRLLSRVRYRRRGHRCPEPVPHRIFAQPKPKWVRDEVIRLKALMPEAGCRTIAHHFNRRWRNRRQMTVSKTYVADTCRKHEYEILHVRRKLKHRVPRPMPRNSTWGCDLLAKTDSEGRTHLALAILDHGSRACMRLQRLADKSSLRLLQELAQAVKRYGRPHYLRTDNEAVFISRWFRCGLWLLGIRHQRIQLGCPWQNGRVERFIGTVKQELGQDVLTGSQDLEDKLTTIRQWYNHERPHDHLQGQTPAEVWAGIDVFATRAG